MTLAADMVHAARGGRPVLRAASLAVAPGELVAVIGPNGAGKSTLLDILTGSRRPDRGTVTLDGRPLADWPRPALARRRAVLPQASTLDFPFPVLDVVLLGRSPHAGGGDRARDLRVAAAALRATGLQGLAHRRYTTLSGGERQRAQLARALAQIWPADDDPSPAYLLLDEPTNNLDLAHQHELLAAARELTGRGVGVLAILHDPNLAAQYADRLAILAGGTVAASGPPAAILDAGTLAETFGVEAEILTHPRTGRPVVLSTGRATAGTDRQHPTMETPR
ncbi:heme ABC transporter ATP-binding protein [Salinisphaera sp. PC39]|uniref:heme ABC transporter ATP-binding protein n=1 Tax=Salinisphaera sp. PC39 TaxID=1304156 RepID=UPI00333E7D65